MKCEDIQEKLSAYIDGVTSPEERAVIEEHLSSCHACKETLSDLEKTMSYVKNLEEVDPPVWLSQKVMTKVREEAAPNEGILHKLFYPLHVKVPIQAIATILIAVSAFYIFKTIQPELRPSRVAENEMRAPQALLKDKDVSSRTKTDMRNIPAAGKAPASVVTADRTQRDREVGKETAVSGGKTGFSPERKETKMVPPEEKEEVVTHEFRKPLPAEPTKQLSHARKPATGERNVEVLSAQEPSEKKEVMKGISDVEMRDESGIDQMPVRAGDLAEKKERFIDITLSAENPENAQKDIEKIVEQLEGKIIKTEKLKDKTIIIVTCNTSKTNELLDKLRLIGKIRERVGISEKPEGQGEIRIELIKE